MAKHNLEFISLVNGKEQTKLSVVDRGLLYGDGCFTTIKVQRGVAQFWSLHCERLKRGMQQLCAQPLSTTFMAQLAAEVQEVAQQHQDCGVRITLTRGVGGRGYASGPASLPLTRIVTAFAYPEIYKTWQQQGIKAATAKSYLMPIQPQLVGLKTLNRLEQVLIKQELAETNWDDLIVLDDQGFIVEASASNIFWRQGHNWYTPALDTCGVHGVVRQAVLNKYPQVQQVKKTLSMLKKADEAFLCNALMGQVSLQQVDEYKFPVVRDYSSGTVPQLMDQYV